MAEKDISGSLDLATKKATGFLNIVQKIDTAFKKLNKTASGVGSAFGGGTGAGNTGVGNSFSMGGSDASFSNFMGGIGGGLQNFGKGKIGIAGAAMQAAGTGLKIAGNIGNMMPDVNATMSRMSQGYNVAIMNGMSGGNNEFRASMQRNSLAMMGTGLTSAGADMQVAGIMASSGIAYSSDPNSVYMRNLRQVSGLAKYMNVDNSVAAQSMADLTSGATSATLMRNFGINTSDPVTGKMLDFKDVASQFENLVGGGRKHTVQGILDSYHRGALGASLQNSGFDELQQQMIIQDLLSKAKTGKGIDFADTEQMDKLANDNPMLSQYKLAASDTKQMGKAEGAYKTGVDAAVNGLTMLNDAAGDLAATFGSLKAGVQTFTGHRAGAGFLGAVGDFFSGLAGGGGSTSSIGMPSPTSGMSSFASASGYSGGGGGGGLTSSIGKPSAPTPSGSNSSGGGGVAASNAKKQNTSAQFKCIKPVRGGRIIADWHTKGARWKPDGLHKAVDWDVPEGTTVLAAHNGVVHTHDRAGSELGKTVTLWWTDNGSDRTYKTQYGHLSGFLVADGTVVKQGTPIAKSGRTGTNCDGPHLHFEVWKGTERVNPHNYLIDGEPPAATTPDGTTDNTSNGDSGNAAGQNTQIGLPVSLSASNQISFSSGALSGTGSTDYYHTGGGSSSTIGIDNPLSGKYTSVNASKNYLAIGGASGLGTSLLQGNQSGSRSSNNVVINLSIAQATDAEAKIFAKKVKEYIEQDNLMSAMGRI